MARTILFTALMLFGWTQSVGAEMTSDTFIQESEVRLSEQNSWRARPRGAARPLNSATPQGNVRQG